MHSYAYKNKIGPKKLSGISAISLEATEIGQPLYVKYGFVKMDTEMELPLSKRHFSCYNSIESKYIK